MQREEIAQLSDEELERQYTLHHGRADEQASPIYLMIGTERQRRGLPRPTPVPEPLTIAECIERHEIDHAYYYGHDAYRALREHLENLTGCQAQLGKYLDEDRILYPRHPGETISSLRAALVEERAQRLFYEEHNGQRVDGFLAGELWATKRPALQERYRAKARQ